MPLKITSSEAPVSAAGASGLVLLLFAGRWQAFGISFWPGRTAAEYAVLLGICGFIALILSNRLRKRYAEPLYLRIAGGTGAVMLVASVAYMLATGYGVWRHWPVYAAAVLVVAYALLGAFEAARRVPVPELTRAMSLYARVVLGLVPLILLFAQAGGGALRLAPAYLKAVLVIYGFGSLLAAGLAGLLAARHEGC